MMNERQESGNREDSAFRIQHPSMERQDFLGRTKAFTLQIVRSYAVLPKSAEAQVIGKQVLRAGTSMGVHLREGKRSRSDARDSGGWLARGSGLQSPTQLDRAVSFRVPGNR